MLKGVYWPQYFKNFHLDHNQNYPDIVIPFLPMSDQIDLEVSLFFTGFYDWIMLIGKISSRLGRICFRWASICHHT